MNNKFIQQYTRLLEATKQRIDDKCWKGYTKKGTKTIKKNGKKTRVNNCVKNEETFTPCDHCKQRSKCEAAGKCLLNVHKESSEELSQGKEFHLGENLGTIAELQKFLKNNVEADNYTEHVGYGDTHPNTITIHDVTRLGHDVLDEIFAFVESTHDELYEAAKCTGPTKKASSTSKGKKYMKCVKDGDGYKRIHWGQKGAKASSGNSKRKKAFRARHKCSSAKSNTPRGQACKDW